MKQTGLLNLLRKFAFTLSKKTRLLDWTRKQDRWIREANRVDEMAKETRPSRSHAPPLTFLPTCMLSAALDRIERDLSSSSLNLCTSRRASQARAARKMYPAAASSRFRRETLRCDACLQAPGCKHLRGCARLQIGRRAAVVTSPYSIGLTPCICWIQGGPRQNHKCNNNHSSRSRWWSQVSESTIRSSGLS